MKFSVSEEWLYYKGQAGWQVIGLVVLVPDVFGISE